MLSTHQVDDKTISDSEGLWRHIHPEQFIWDQQASKWRPASGAFIDRRGELSVDRASLTTIEQSPADKPSHSLVEVEANILRKMGYVLVPDPLESNPAHTLICGRMTKAHARELARLARWLVCRRDG
jgi:hypothetical protein